MPPSGTLLPVRVFQTRPFKRWLRSQRIKPSTLISAVEEMQQGLIDADLGRNLYKKRISLPGQGKRGGARTLIATRLAERWFFLEGFSKNQQSNITSAELKALQELGQTLLLLTDQELEQLLKAGTISEVHDE